MTLALPENPLAPKTMQPRTITGNRRRARQQAPVYGASLTPNHQPGPTRRPDSASRIPAGWPHYSKLERGRDSGSENMHIAARSSGGLRSSYDCTPRQNALDVSDRKRRDASDTQVIVTENEPHTGSPDDAMGTRSVRIAAIGDLHLHDEIPAQLAEDMRQVDAHVDLIVIAGDITEGGRLPEGELAHAMLSEITTPVIAVLGNHDRRGPRRVALRKLIQSAGDADRFANPGQAELSAGPGRPHGRGKRGRECVAFCR